MKGIRVKFSDFDKVYPEEKKQKLRSLILSWYVHRTIGKLLAWISLRAGIPANALTVCSIIAVTAASVLLAVGSTVATLIIGLFLLWMWAILDGADGHVARITGPTVFGEFLDRLGADFKRALFYPCVGIRAISSPGWLSETLIERGVPSYAPLFLGCAASVFSLWTVCVAFKFRSAFTNHLTIKKEIFVIATNLIEFEIVFIIVAAIFRGWDMFVAFYAVSYFAILIAAFNFHIRAAITLSEAQSENGKTSSVSKHEKGE
ncbi:MAG: CDP-alcohol phosphatidyltransferase family protein [Planctomycetota bacterium]|nr:CDP-alcohol phosphatidyltransferase family protein [Planctomycetota bacterium]